jgi:hypothetical protein
MTLKALPPSDAADGGLPIYGLGDTEAEMIPAAFPASQATYPDVLEEQEHDAFLALRGHLEQMTIAFQEAQATVEQARRNAVAAELGYSIFGGQLSTKYGLAAEDQITPRGRIVRAPRS